MSDRAPRTRLRAPHLTAAGLLLAALGTSCSGTPDSGSPHSGTSARVHQPAATDRPYSGAVRSGDFVFVAGKVGRYRESFASEVRSALDAVEQELAVAGLGLRDVVSATVYLTDIDDYAALNEVYAERMPAPYPARTCLAVAAIPGGARLEIQVIASR